MSKKRVQICFIVFLFATLQVTTVVAAEHKHRTFQKLDHYLKSDPQLTRILAGVSIRSASSGDLVYNYNGDMLLRPASNVKLLTTAAALTTLGPDYTFDTEVLTDGNIRSKILHGDLYVKGKGDPTLLKSDLDDIAKDLHEKGIKIIHGDLIADDHWYDHVRYSIDLPWSDETKYYAAQVSALTVAPKENTDPGTVILEITPGKSIGAQAIVTIEPKTNDLKIINNTQTTDKQASHKLHINRKHGTNTITIEGDLPINATPTKEFIPIWEPTEHVLQLVKQSLKEHQIILMGDVKRGTTPQKATMLSSHTSRPLSEVIVPLMKLSHNCYAEILTKEMGKAITGEGSWNKGLEVLTITMDELGLDKNTLFLRDGSGISHVNLLSANEISKLLYVIQGEEWFPVFYEALPLAGAGDQLQRGTLKHRLMGPATLGKVRAKTGTLTTVSSLSGYVETKSGETLIVSILLNNVIPEYVGKNIEDHVITIVAN